MAVRYTFKLAQTCEALQGLLPGSDRPMQIALAVMQDATMDGCFGQIVGVAGLLRSLLRDLQCAPGAIPITLSAQAVSQSQEMIHGVLGKAAGLGLHFQIGPKGVQVFG